MMFVIPGAAQPGVLPSASGAGVELASESDLCLFGNGKVELSSGRFAVLLDASAKADS